MPSPAGVGARSPITPLKFVQPGISETRFSIANVLTLSASMTGFSVTIPKLINEVGQLVAGTKVFSGSLGKQVSAVLTAAFNFTGTVAKQTVAALAASFGFTGAISKQTSAVLSAGMKFSASIVKQVGAVLSGAFGFSGTTGKQTSAPLSGSFGFTGAVSKQTSAALNAQMSTLSTALSKQASAALSAAFGFSATVSKQTSRAYAAAMATLSGVISDIKSLLVLITASTQAFTALITKQTSAALSGKFGFSGAIAKQTSAVLSGAFGFVGSVSKQISVALTSQTSKFSASVVKQVNAALSGAFGFIASQSRQIGAAFTGSFGLSGAVGKQTSRAYAAATKTFSGTLSDIKSLLVLITASTQTFVASIGKQTGANRSASFGFQSTINKATSAVFTASMGFAASTQKQFGRAISAALSLWQTILNAVKSSNPVAPIVLPSGVVMSGFGPAYIAMAAAGTQTFTQEFPVPIVRANNWQLPGQQLMGGKLLVAPLSGGLSDHIWTVVAQGTVTIPSSASGAGVAFSLFQNYFAPFRSDSLGFATQSLAPGQYNWTVVSKLSGNGAKNGALRADYVLNINGTQTTGVAFSNTHQMAEPQLQLSIATTFSGTISPSDLFQATMTRFDLIQ